MTKSCNGSLPPGGWLIVTCGLTACAPGSAPGPTLGNKYGKHLPFSCSSDVGPYNVFQWAGQLPKTARSRVGSGPPSNTWFLGPTWVTPKWRLETRSVHPFLHGSLVWATDIHMERQRYSFCRNRPHLCCASDATQNKERNLALAN